MRRSASTETTSTSKPCATGDVVVGRDVVDPAAARTRWPHSAIDVRIEQRAVGGEPDDRVAARPRRPRRPRAGTASARRRPARARPSRRASVASAATASSSGSVVVRDDDLVAHAALAAPRRRPTRAPGVRRGRAAPCAGRRVEPVRAWMTAIRRGICDSTSTTRSWSASVSAGIQRQRQQPVVRALGLGEVGAGAAGVGVQRVLVDRHVVHLHPDAGRVHRVVHRAPLRNPHREQVVRVAHARRRGRRQVDRQRRRAARGSARRARCAG